MLRVVAALCLSSLIAAAPSGAAAAEPSARTTHRTLDAFRDCFIASQQKANRPWAYVLSGDDGGTFSTVPNAGGDSPYLLAVRQSGDVRRIALSGEAAAGSGPSIGSAVDACLR